MGIQLALLVVIQYLGYVVYRDIYAQSLSKEAALGKIDARIDELREAEDGAAGTFAAAAIEELEKLRADLESSVDRDPEQVVQDYLFALSDASESGIKKTQRIVGSSFDNIHTSIKALDESFQAFLDRISQNERDADQKKAS